LPKLEQIILLSKKGAVAQATLFLFGRYQQQGRIMPLTDSGR